MKRHLRRPSVVLLLALGAGAPATAAQVGQPTVNRSAAGPLSYMRLSEAAIGRFDALRPGVPAAIGETRHSGSEANGENTRLLYRPPLRGAPASRIGGGSRGVDGVHWVLRVLAPMHTGLTNQASPSLYWYTSKAVSGQQMEVTIIKQDAPDPVLETKLPGRMATGIQRLDLSRWGIELETGTEYEWFVSVLQDPAQRSNDIIAGGTIQRVAPDPRIRALLFGSGPRAAPLIYAEQGIWYDAIDTLSRLIEANPEDDALRNQRARLLDEVDLEATIADSREDG